MGRLYLKDLLCLDSLLSCIARSCHTGAAAMSLLETKDPKGPAARLQGIHGLHATQVAFSSIKSPSMANITFAELLIPNTRLVWV